MSTLLNKSNHPVNVKKIPITLWSLRDEIEEAIKLKIEANAGNTENLDISDIQEFYSDLKTYDDLPNEDEEDDEEDGDLDPSGNPMDDDAKAMMEAMGGGDAAEGEESDAEGEETKAQGDEESKEEAEEGEKSEEDDAAAALAAEMLEGQGGDGAVADKDAEALAAEMLGDQAPTSEDTKEEAGFRRVYPAKKDRDFGFVFLSDLNMEQALIFSRKKYMTGSSVIIELDVPRKFTLTAEVITSFAINMNSRVISETKPNYRIQCKLHFSFEGERTFLREFLKQIEPDVPPPPSKLKKPATQKDDEDEFDDLGF